MDKKILRMNWRGNKVDIKVEIDKCTLLDIVVEYEDEAKKKGFRRDYAYPTFGYSYEMKHHILLTDTDLMLMFTKLSEKSLIDIWVGTVMKPNALYKLVLNLKRQNENAKKQGASKQGVIAEDDDMSSGDENVSTGGGNVSLDELEDTSPIATTQPKKIVKGNKAKNKPKPVKKGKGPVNLPPPPISPKTAFQNLPIRRSPRFSPPPIAPTCNSSQAQKDPILNKKIPRTTARRKGLVVGKSDTIEHVPKLVRHTRVRDQSNAAKAARAAAKAAKGNAQAGPSIRKRKSTTQGTASQPSQAFILTTSQAQHQN